MQSLRPLEDNNNESDDNHAALPALESPASCAHCENSDDLGQALPKNILIAGHSIEHKDVQKLCKELYECERFQHIKQRKRKLTQEQVVFETDKSVFKKCGTSDITMSFYDNIDNGFFFKLKKKVMAWHCISFIRSKIFSFPKMYFASRFFILTSIYYLDYVKDFFFMGTLGGFATGYARYFGSNK